MNYRRIVLSCLTALAATASLNAIVIYVKPYTSGPSDGLTWGTAFRTIQPALNIAQPGDEVWVAGSREPENLVIYTPGVALLGGFSGSETSKDKRPSGYPTKLTVHTPAAAITLTPLAAAATVEGFSVDRRDRETGPGLVCSAMGVTIRDCTFRYCGAVSGDVGGIGFGPGTSGTVENCLIENCWSANGGGILARNADIKVLNCRIRSNEAMYSLTSSPDYYQMAWGGGVCIIGGSALVRGNEIRSNVARHGGGIWADSADLTISHNDISMNTAYRDSPLDYRTTVQTFGGGLYLSNCRSMLDNNVIAANEAYAVGYTALGSRGEAWAGGLGVFYCPDTIIRNNTIVDNVASAVGASDSYQDTLSTGGGAVVLNGQTVVNCIFSGNRSVCGPGGRASAGNLYATEDRDITDNLFDGDAPVSSTYGGILNRAGNISADPAFLSGSPAYRLSPASPAIDRGEVSYVPQGETDLSGAPRIRGARVDIGAFEADVPPAPTRIYVSPQGADAADGTTWATAKRSIQAGVQVVATDGEVWVREGTYTGSLFVPSRVALRGGFRGDESAPEQRDRWSHPTIIDGQHKAGSGVIVARQSAGVTLNRLVVRDPIYAGIQIAGRNSVASECVVEGGRIVQGGVVAEAFIAGIVAYGSPVTIRECVVRDNSARAYTTGGAFYSYAIAEGGGIVVRDVQATVINNLVVANSISAGGLGGWGGAHGGGILAQGTSGTIANNTVLSNTGNPSSTQYPGVGGIVVTDATPDLVVANNIVAYNSEGVTGTGAPTFRRNCLYGNTRGNAVILPDPTGSLGNISADPLFASVGSGDYRLQPLSPCVDAGDDAFAIGPTDLDGNPRIAGLHVDLGCYESAVGGPYTVGDAASALRVAAGLGSATGALFTRLDADRPDFHHIDLTDAVRILREVNGLE